MAPEYALWGHLSHKADVYSFGIVALEIIAGKNNMKYRAIENYVCLLDWALALQKKGNLVELMDPKLGSNFNEEEAIKILKVALSCTNPSSVVRPTMSAVVRMLEGDICVEELMMDQSEYGDDFRFKSLRDKYYELQRQNSSEGQTLIDLSETARNGSSSTTSHDLYPISLDSH
ncbi:probable LRR receptor-like serine/threonine-protein kinase At1g29720 [Camellia sinensis]|uniref:probable LRR receptor-like serine/threonine-protein kinase At1g29720 n=1 Tax=Camellia sinensis TaxID=4442 RepID=UPI00103645F4|nr:probable LRR receptor-like serine/threonine-protein kinase At1g29720 [Camellia sinensis]